MKPITSRQLAVDLGAVALVSAGVLCFADRPAWMGALVAVTLVGRFVLWARLHPARSLAVEVAFFVSCTVVGAFNDFNTVALHGVYAYAVPSELPALSSIPIWMLAFWGLIVRFVFALTRWEALGPPEAPGRVILGRRSTALELAVVACVVVATRLSIFARWDEPVGSWLPFVVALVAYGALGRVDRHDLRLAALALLVGPVVEALFIQIGGLHRYALGWLGGVPLWIVLWWALATWLCKDVGAHAYAGLERLLRARASGASRAPSARPAAARTTLPRTP